LKHIYFIIFLFFVSSIGCLYASNDSTNNANRPFAILDLSPDQSNVGIVTIHPKDSYSIDLHKISSIYTKALWSDKTTNPFEGKFPKVYQGNYRKKLKQCEYKGFFFELDDNPETKEWYLTTNIPDCYQPEKTRYRPIGWHSWIIQKKSSKYRILMESVGRIYIQR